MPSCLTTRASSAIARSKSTNDITPALTARSKRLSSNGRASALPSINSMRLATPWARARLCARDRLSVDISMPVTLAPSSAICALTSPRPRPHPRSSACALSTCCASIHASNQANDARRDASWRDAFSGVSCGMPALRAATPSNNAACAATDPPPAGSGSIGAVCAGLADMRIPAEREKL